MRRLSRMKSMEDVMSEESGVNELAKCVVARYPISG